MESGFDWQVRGTSYTNKGTQKTFKRAGCFADKKYLRCATLINQVHTWIVSKKFRHEEQPQDTPNHSSMEQSLKLLNYALVVSTDVQS